MKQKSLTGSKLRFRKSFGAMIKPVEVPNLIQLQRLSYDKFLQRDIPPEKRKNIGLQAIFKSVFPISDYNETVSLEFVNYQLFHPKYDVRECLQKRGMTYASPLKVTFRLVIFDSDKEGEEKSIRDVKEQEVYLSDIPLMTDHASFVINGTERVVVSQIHRSPGVFFDHDGGKNSASGKFIYSARFIPYRGSWLDFEFDQKDIVNVRIDRKRKFPATIFLKALGLSSDEILKEFHQLDEIFSKKGKFFRTFNVEKMEGRKINQDIKNKEGSLLVRAGRRVTRSVVKKIKQAGITEMEISPEELQNSFLAEPLVDPKTGEVLCESNETLTTEWLEKADSIGIKRIPVVFFDEIVSGPYISNTLRSELVSTREEALLDIYRRMKPGEAPVLEAAEYYFQNLFFKEGSYDLGQVGRIKINHRFNFTDIPETEILLDQKRHSKGFKAFDRLEKWKRKGG